MAKIRIGNMIITSNEALTNKISNIFTQSGYQQVNRFLANTSRDYRDLFSVLCEMYQTQATVYYDSSFREILKRSKSFDKFILAVYVQRLAKAKIPFEEFYPELISSCYINYQTKNETGARGYVVGAFHYLASTYSKHKDIFPVLTNSIDITENLHSGRVLYVDDRVALTYNQDTKSDSLGELLFAARTSQGLWSFDKTDITVPIKSLRQAKKALSNYQEKPRKGELVGNDAKRLAKFLGLEIRDNYAYMSNYQEPKNYRGKGFK